MTHDQPVFPFTRSEDSPSEPGLSSRDYAALMFMHALISSGADSSSDGLAEQAFEHADALIERSERPLKRKSMRNAMAG